MQKRQLSRDEAGDWPVDKVEIKSVSHQVDRSKIEPVAKLAFRRRARGKLWLVEGLLSESEEFTTRECRNG